jgi:Protein of unknown function (DUF2971)
VSTAALDTQVSGILGDQAANRPDMLWHYTNATGFLGICRSGKLWATNTDYLNDASEMRHARRLVLKAVFDSRSKAQNREEHEMLNLVCDCMGSDATRPVFVTSLSAAKNELSQWRAYGGATGSFALGFSVTSMLAAIGKNTEIRFSLYKCIYDEAGSQSLCQQFVDRLLEEFRAQRAVLKPGANDYQEMMDLVHEAVRLFDTLAPLIKHPDFIAEAEWRLVSDPVDLTKRPIRLREGKTGVVPYVELTIAKDKSDPRFTVHTLVGPSIRHNPRNTNLAQIAYCDDFIFQPFPVEASNTPYRHG